jgi:signal transduction histidine kinase
MARLVGNLLALARADAGQRLGRKPVELDRVLLDVFQQTRLLARDVKVMITDLDQLVVLGDPDALKQLLLILADNAAKYTPAGGCVSLSLRREQGSALVSIEDSGIGIEPEDLAHVFERFYRSGKARAWDAGGTGLGLAIAQWIAEEHGGSIAASSQPDRGSVFTVQLPLADELSSQRPDEP